MNQKKLNKFIIDFDTEISISEMKVLNYNGLDEWRVSSIVKKKEEDSFEKIYNCYEKASQILDKVEQELNTMKKGNVLDVILKCEDIISQNAAFPVSICHPSIVSNFEPESSEEWKDIPYNINISAQVNGYIVERTWTVKVNILDSLLEQAINLISPGYSIQKWSEWMETELNKLKLYPINGQCGYELQCNGTGVILPNKKHTTSEEFKENAVYSVKIVAKTSQENEIPLHVSTKWYSINKNGVDLKLLSSRKIMYNMSKRRMKQFCQRHISNIYGYQLGLKELKRKNVITGHEPLLLPTSHCIKVGKTVILKPTHKLIL